MFMANHFKVLNDNKFGNLWWIR